MTALGSQLWFMRDERGDMQRPRGSKVGVVSVRVLMRTCEGLSEDTLVFTMRTMAYSSGESLDKRDGFLASRVC